MLRALRDQRWLGLGTMRLSTERDRDDERAIRVLHAAFDAGITFVDTADAYCLDASETGHNERLVARALASWTGERERILVATKGGLTRPHGAWVADGRSRTLATACEASRRALGLERIPLYQLHAPDPRTPLTTSVRALHALKRDRIIEAIGLCNVTVGQIQAACAITEIAAVQVELSVWHDASVLNGVVEHCIANGILLLAHRPLGGPQRRRRTLADPVLREVAERHGATPFEIALAWLLALSPLVVPLPGATRIETARSVARAHAIALSDDERAQLDDHFPAGRVMKLRQSRARPSPDSAGGREIVLIMGIPGAGKSTLAAAFVGRGYTRLNRDESGGTLRDLAASLERALEGGASRIVLDNTYVSRKSRAAVLAAAWTRGVPVRCVWLDTAVEDAQVNAAWRLVVSRGCLPTPRELRRRSAREPEIFGPGVQFRYQRELEPPDDTEGFSSIEVVRFERRRDPDCSNRAVIFWLDNVLRRSRPGGPAPASPDDIEIIPGRREVLKRYAADGWRLLGVSWHPEIEAGEVGQDVVEAGFVRTRELLDVDLDIAYCPHGAGPPVCWCRKPLPGLGVVFIQRYRLDPARCLYVGAGPQDPGFARRLGFEYRDANAFFQAEAQS
ncbi:MAG TPA: aldo/keto reductase [Vicinamibacterales bacterium]|nr:aldo/keto reductase [Vicinamibacterales bacterium]